MKENQYKFYKNIFKGMFDMLGICLQILACVLTYIIVVSDIDWKYFVYVQGVMAGKGMQDGSGLGHDILRIFSGATGIGMIVPIIGIPVLFTVAIMFKDKKAHLTGQVLAMSAALGWSVSAMYKSLTGRVQPPHDIIINNSHNWNFGFWEHGIFWGWPSSHTTVAFAMAFAMVYMYPHNKCIKYIAVIYALYIGIGITMQIHWLSEFVAGALIGMVVGRAVGRSAGR